MSRWLKIGKICPLVCRVLALFAASWALSACVRAPLQFHLPEKVAFDGVNYHKITHTQLGEMQQSLYLPKDRADQPPNPDDWAQGLLFFVDSRHTPLAERLALREKAFARQTGTQAKLAILNDELQSQVIYPPTERFQNQQLEVSRGRNSACGFSQMQLSHKRLVSEKNLQQPLADLALAFAALAWQIECR